ncbi:hypothetical protein C2E23DRAFT_857200 [Lenzites betulinus]|nr:hypothetical protein C2E23DRAFT_857200 [Lenzites betulinus]
MSNPQNAADVISEALHLITVNTAGTRSLVSLATLGNVGKLSTSLNLSFDVTQRTLVGWNRVVPLQVKPLDDDAAVKVLDKFTDLVKVYKDFMNELIENHDVLCSKESGLEPGDGRLVGGKIQVYRTEIGKLQMTLKDFVPNLFEELEEQGELMQKASDAAAAHYPPPP